GRHSTGDQDVGFHRLFSTAALTAADAVTTRVADDDNGRRRGNCAAASRSRRRRRRVTFTGTNRKAPTGSCRPVPAAAPSRLSHLLRDVASAARILARRPTPALPCSHGWSVHPG